MKLHIFGPFFLPHFFFLLLLLDLPLFYLGFFPNFSTLPTSFASSHLSKIKTPLSPYFLFSFFLSPGRLSGFFFICPFYLILFPFFPPSSPLYFFVHFYFSHFDNNNKPSLLFPSSSVSESEGLIVVASSCSFLFIFLSLSPIIIGLLSPSRYGFRLLLGAFGGCLLLLLTALSFFIFYPTKTRCSLGYVETCVTIYLLGSVLVLSYGAKKSGEGGGEGLIKKGINRKKHIKSY